VLNRRQGPVPQLQLDVHHGVKDVNGESGANDVSDETGANDHLLFQLLIRGQHANGHVDFVTILY